MDFTVIFVFFPKNNQTYLKFTWYWWHVCPQPSQNHRSSTLNWDFSHTFKSKPFKLPLTRSSFYTTWRKLVPGSINIIDKNTKLKSRANLSFKNWTLTPCFMTSWYRQSCLWPGLVEFMSILAIIFSYISYQKRDKKSVWTLALKYHNWPKNNEHFRALAIFYIPWPQI